jgi:hypothetical protein
MAAVGKIDTTINTANTHASVRLRNVRSFIKQISLHLSKNSSYIKVNINNKAPLVK